MSTEGAAAAVQEENAWKDAAAAVGGGGLDLLGVELDDMEALYPLLMRNASDVVEKTRLRGYIRRLQAQGEPQRQRNGRLRCCSRIQRLLRMRN
jgi:hypothetical protein